MKTAHVIPCAIALALIAVPLLPAQAATQRHPGRKSSTPLTIEQINDVALTRRVGPGSSGAAVLRAEILLDRARFSPGEIDAAFGSNLKQAILGYQASNGLQTSGVVDAPTWAALDRDTADAVTTYTLTDADEAGPFAPIPADMSEKAKLKTLGFTSPTEELGERFHASPALLQKLNPGKDLTRSGTEITVPSVDPASPLPKGAQVIVKKADSTVTLVDAAGNTLAQFPASTGSDHDPLPLGTWKIKGVTRDPVYHYNPALFWDADQNNPKETIAAGPNNPVGVVWIDLSIPHYGIHGTPEPSKIGKTESHGCIRMTNWDALELSKAVFAGMPAILQE